MDSGALRIQREHDRFFAALWLRVAARSVLGW